MLKKTGKALVWLVGVALSLFVVAYGVLLVVNREDRPPSPDIAALKALQPTTPEFVDEQNAYLYLLGFEAPPGTGPMELGLEQHAWMQTAGPEFDANTDPLDEGNSLAQSAGIYSFRKACGESETECLQILEGDDGTIERLLSEDSLLVERYIELTSMKQFREATPFHALAPMPSYSIVFDGQYLTMLGAWRSANAGDMNAVRAALERDLVFWRMVLENSDVLITKMIAAAAIRQHLKLGNLVLRRLPDTHKAAGIPPSWRKAITMPERSMRRSLAGEWMFFDSMIGEVHTENPFDNWAELADSATVRRIAWILLRPFWQQQDTSNRQARLMLDIGKTFDVPYKEMPNAVEIAGDLHTSAYSRFSRLYNFAGDLLMVDGTVNMSNYALRVADLEGVRRAALLAAELRAEGVTKNDVVQRLLVSDIVDPYTTKPFAWHDDVGAIVFHGLEPYDRSVHRLIY